MNMQTALFFLQRGISNPKSYLRFYFKRQNGDEERYGK